MEEPLSNADPRLDASTLDDSSDAPIAQKVKKPRSPAQVLAFQKAMDKRLLLASQKKIEEAKRIESGMKLAKPSKPVVEEEEEEEVRVVKKPKKKRIIYVESDSEEELVVKRKEKKQLPPPAPEPIQKIEKPKPVYVFL